MAIEQERTEAAISELHCQTPTRLAQEGIWLSNYPQIPCQSYPELRLNRAAPLT